MVKIMVVDRPPHHELNSKSSPRRAIAPRIQIPLPGWCWRATNTSKTIPEPEECVDLLIQDVERKNAQCVMLFDASRGTVLVEGALGLAGEHQLVR